MFNQIKHKYNQICYLKSLRKALKDYQKKSNNLDSFNFPYTGLCHYYKENFPKLQTFLKADLISMGYDTNFFVTPNLYPLKQKISYRIELLERLIQINKL